MAAPAGFAWHRPVGPALEAFLREHRVKKYEDANFILMSGHYGGKLRVEDGEDARRLYALLGEEWARARAIGLECVPLPVVERRTPTYRLFHDVDVCNGDRRYLEDTFLPHKLPAILRAHCDLFGLDLLECVVFTSCRAKGDLWKTGVHLYMTRAERGGEEIPVLVDREMATKAVLHARVFLGEALQPSEDCPSILDACVHDENGLRIPFVAKSDQPGSCVACYAEGAEAYAGELPALLAKARCVPTRRWLEEKGEKAAGDRPKLHRLLADIAAFQLPEACTCGCKWDVWNHMHAVRSRSAPCYQGRRVVLGAYLPHAMASVGPGGYTCDPFQYDLDPATVAQLLEGTSIRAEGKPTVAISPTARDLELTQEVWAKHHGRGSKGNRQVGWGLFFCPSSARSPTDRASPQNILSEHLVPAVPTAPREGIGGRLGLREAILGLGDRDEFKRAFPAYAKEMGGVQVGVCGVCGSGFAPCTNCDHPHRPASWTRRPRPSCSPGGATASPARSRASPTAATAPSWSCPPGPPPCAAPTPSAGSWWPARRVAGRASASRSGPRPSSPPTTSGPSSSPRPTPATTRTTGAGWSPSTSRTPSSGTSRSAWRTRRRARGSGGPRTPSRSCFRL